MSKICQISGKRVMFGNNVSKAINKTRRRFDINLVKKRFFIPEQNKWVTLKVTTSILKTINKKRFVFEMPMAIAKIQSSITDRLPIPPILTRDQCEILSESDNIVSNNFLTLNDLEITPSDIEVEMKKWLWRYKDGGQFAKV